MQHLKPFLPWESAPSLSPLPTPPAEPLPYLGSAPLTATAVTAGAAAGATHLAARDVDAIGKKLNDWADTTTKAVGEADKSLPNAQRAIEAYTRGGREAIQSRVLGLPLAHWFTQLSVPARGVDGEAGLHGFQPYKDLLKSRLNGNMAAQLPAAHQHLHQHYAKYFDSKVPIEQLHTYMQSFGLDQSKFNEMGKAVLGDSTLLLSNRFARLKTVDPQGYTLFRQHVPQLVSRLAGGNFSGKVHGGLADVYRSVMSPHIQSLGNNLRGVRNVALPLAGVAAGAELLNHWRGQSKEAAQLPLTPTDPALGIGSVLPWAASIPMAFSGVKDLMRPLEVGLSYGAMPEVGAGHKTPAKSIGTILETLKSDSKTPKFNLRDLQRSTAGWVNPELSKLKYDGLADTGWGAYIPEGWGNSFSPFKNNAGVKVTDPKLQISTGGYLGVQTDLGDLGMPGNTARTARHGWDGVKMKSSLKESIARRLGLSDSFVSYDPNPDRLKADPVLERLKLLHTGKHGFPTITPDALDTLKQLRSTNRGDLIKEMLQDNSLPENTRKQLEGIGDRRLLAITGSGRGDQVAYRAQELQKKIQASGLGDKWKVMAMLGDSAGNNPIAQRVAADPDILSFGKLPQKFYIGLPGSADFHAASSGTSALMESLGTSGHLNFHPDQNNWKEREMRALGNFDFEDPAAGNWGLKNIQPHPDIWAGREASAPDVMKGIQSVDLEAWNRGNKEFAWKFPGVSNAQSEDDIVKLLGDEKLFSPEAVAARGARADHMIASHGNARDKLQEHLSEWLQKRRKFVNLKGLGKLSGAGALGVAGALPMLLQILNQKNNPLPQTTDEQR